MYKRIRQSDFLSEIEEYKGMQRRMVEREDQNVLRLGGRTN
jgi:hypothetical protein